MKINILPAAWEDLKQIEDYYLMEFDAQTALKVSNHILDCIERLEEHPDSGSLTPDEWLNQQGYRMVICKLHVAIYRLSPPLFLWFSSFSWLLPHSVTDP